MGIQRKIKKLDIFGKPVQLRLEKKKVHKTLCGGIVTLFIIIMVAFITTYYVLKFFSKQNPGIDVMTTINQEQKISAQSFKYGFAINIYNVNDKGYSSQGAFQLNDLLISNKSQSLINKGFSIKAYYQTCLETNSTEYAYNRIEIPLVPCSENQQFNQYWEHLFNLPANQQHQFLCPIFEDSLKESITIQGGFSSNQQKQIQIVVNIQDEIKQNSNWQNIINNSLVVAKVFDEMTFLESYENPIYEQCRTITQYIDLDQIKFIELKYNQQIVSTDEGIYFNAMRDQSLKQLGEISYFNKQSDLSNNPQILKITTYVSKTKSIFQRNYLKASLMLAYIGGFLQLTLIFGKSVTKPFSKLSFYTSLVNEVFQFEDEKQKQQKMETKLNETEQKPLQQQLTNLQQTTMLDETCNKNLNQSILRSRSLFHSNHQKKEYLDTSQDISQHVQDQFTSPNRLNIKNPKNSYIFSKNIEDEILQKNNLQIDTKKDSVYSFQTSDLNNPIQIKKKSLFKNQNLLQNFREYFEADRLEKRLIISIKIVLVEFFKKFWIFIKLICSKNKVNHMYYYSAIEKLKFSKNKVNERLDIIYIVQKLQEIDKLKQIVLDKNQRKLFEYLPRPVLKNEYIFQQKAPMQKTKSDSKTTEWSILKAEESIQQKAIKAWIAFTEISNKECLDRKDKKVIRLLDVKAKNIFEITSKKIQEEIFDSQSNNFKQKNTSNIFAPSQQTSESANFSRKSSNFIQRKSKNLIQFINVQTSFKRSSSCKDSVKKKASIRDTPMDQPIVSVKSLEKNEENLEIQQKCPSQSLNQVKESKSVTHASQESEDSSLSSSNSSSNSDLSETSDQCQSQFDSIIYNKYATIKQTSFKGQSEIQKQNNLKIELNEIPENIEKSYRNSQDNTVNKSSLDCNSNHNKQNKDSKSTYYLQSFPGNTSFDQAKLNYQKAQESEQLSKLVKRGSQTEKFKDKKFNLFNSFFDQLKNQDDIHLEQIKSKNFDQGSPQLLSEQYKSKENNLLAHQKSPITPNIQQEPTFDFKNDNPEFQRQENSQFSIQQYKSLAKRRNHIINHQKFTTPQYKQKRKNQEDYSDIYNSASFTQFMKKITPIIAQNKVENNNNDSMNE